MNEFAFTIPESGLELLRIKGKDVLEQLGEKTIKDEIIDDQ